MSDATRMLALSEAVLADALDRLEHDDAVLLAGAIDGGMLEDLAREVAALDFARAAPRAGSVEQDYDFVAFGLPDAEPALPPLLTHLKHEFVALASSPLDAATFRPTELYVQRYAPGSRGISVHRDQRRFSRLIVIFSLGAPARFYLHANRRGDIATAFIVESGDLMLLRAPTQPQDPPGPLHSVAGPESGTRYSVSMRMEHRAHDHSS